MKVWTIIGSILIAAAVALGYFFKFDNAVLVQIGVGAFGLASLILGAVKAAKEKSVALWKVILTSALAVAGGVVLCVGGAAESVIAQIAGAVLALISIIVGIVFAKAK